MTDEPAGPLSNQWLSYYATGGARQRSGIIVLLPLPRSDASLSPPVMSWEIGLFGRGRGSEGQEISLSDQRGPLLDYVLGMSISPPRAECGRSWGLHFNYSPHCVLRRAGFFRETRTCETFPRFAIDILHYNSASESPCFDVPVILSAAADGWTSVRLSFNR